MRTLPNLDGINPLIEHLINLVIKSLYLTHQVPTTYVFDVAIRTKSRERLKNILFNKVLTEMGNNESIEEIIAQSEKFSKDIFYITYGYMASYYDNTKDK
jgi:hypothetical protein